MNRYLMNRTRRAESNRYPFDYRRRRERGEYMEDRHYEPYREPYRETYRDYRSNNYPMQYEMYAYGKPYDYSSGEMMYKEDLKKLADRLKKYDKYGMTKEQLIQHSRQMGVDFKDYTEDEFYTTYLMMLSDYKSISNDPNTYIKLAQDFLEDDDTALRGGEKLCAYYYTIILGEE